LPDSHCLLAFSHAREYLWGWQHGAMKGGVGMHTHRQRTVAQLPMFVVVGAPGVGFGSLVRLRLRCVALLCRVWLHRVLFAVGGPFLPSLSANLY
jgi:hypothetical protein